jgi:hypothetical protein
VPPHHKALSRRINLEYRLEIEAVCRMILADVACFACCDFGEISRVVVAVFALAIGDAPTASAVIDAAHDSPPTLRKMSTIDARCRAPSSSARAIISSATVSASGRSAKDRASMSRSVIVTASCWLMASILASALIIRAVSTWHRSPGVAHTNVDGCIVM